MSVADARRELGASLEKAPQLPRAKWAVFPPQTSVDELPQKFVLLLTRTAVTRRGNLAQGLADNEFTLWLIQPQNGGEDALDDALDDVLEALDEVAQTLWTEARRDTYADSYPAYAITLTTTSRRK